MNHPIDRREILQGGLFLGVAALLGGCASQSAQLPNAVWPEALPPMGRPRALAAAPASRSVGGGGGLPPEVIPRSQWTNQGLLVSRLTSNGNGGRMGAVTRITVHHDALDSTMIRTQGDAARRLAQIRTAHINRRPDPFADIGYHYIIDPQGRVWEGRSVYYQGAHVKGQNENNLGIMVMGNFDNQRPTNAALDSLDSFVASQMARYNISLSRVKTHQEMAPTECPGRNLQRYMVATRQRGGAMARA